MIGFNDKPVIGVTMGDPAGIGPEVIVKALAEPEIRRRARFVIYGMNELLSYAADMAELDVYWWRDQHERFDRDYMRGVIVADYDEINWFSTNVRESSKIGGQASMRFACDAIDDALAGKIDAMVTAPISKESWHLAGFKYPGHTELLTDRCRAKCSAMMFVGGPFRVVLATIHMALANIRNRLTIGKVFDPINLANDALIKWFGIEKPKIAVAALNPHAGEAGQFGDDEKRIISPAILMAQEAGINVEGPFPADTLFHKALHEQCYDIIVAMYHDQGLIPIKLLAFDKAVNVTIGIPIIRTSVDHGTAFDIVGRNRANPASMLAALHLACDMALTKKKKNQHKIIKSREDTL
ncbi:MAG: 4-hydroxythreonine-4-phosphate dehydrogenase PdxA [Sedimentisphaerales bacterium]|nr:4-hydroxythreonine-4-phosphate dehydrogenase PdxA [Sedimentisphaerales bacterium]